MPPYPTAVFLSARVRNADWTDAAESVANAKTSSHASNLEYASVNANPTAQERNVALTDAEGSVARALWDKFAGRTAPAAKVVSPIVPERNAGPMDVAACAVTALPGGLVTFKTYASKTGASLTAQEKNAVPTDAEVYAATADQARHATLEHAKRDAHPIAQEKNVVLTDAVVSVGQDVRVTRPATTKACASTSVPETTAPIPSRSTPFPSPSPEAQMSLQTRLASTAMHVREKIPVWAERVPIRCMHSAHPRRAITRSR